MHNKPKKAFTLVEIMIVVVIIGLLSALAIQGFQSVQATSRINTVETNLKNIAGTAQRYLIAEGDFDVTYDDLVAEGYLKEINSVAGEDYSLIEVTEETTSIELVINGSDEPVTYTWVNNL